MKKQNLKKYPCVWSYQREQAGVEEDVTLFNVHAADELPQIRPVVQ